MAAQSTKLANAASILSKTVANIATSACKFGSLCKKYASGTCTYLHTPIHEPSLIRKQLRAQNVRIKAQNAPPKLLTEVKQSGLRHPMIMMVAANRAAHRALMEKKTAALATYFGDSKDVKLPATTPVDREMALLDAEVAAMRTTLRGAFGNQIVKISLYLLINVPTSAGGIANAVQALDPAGLTEFQAMQALFDEYRVVGGETQSVVCSGVSNVSTNNPWVIIVYDPADVAPLASVTDGLSHQQKHMIRAFVTASGEPIQISTRIERFSYKVPNSILDTSATATTTPVNGSWQSTIAGTVTRPYGYLKYYGSTLSASSLGLSTIIEFHTEFRIRT